MEDKVIAYIALGSNLSDRPENLTGKADIAVIGTQTIRIVEDQGVAAVGDFIAGLR